MTTTLTADVYRSLMAERDLQDAIIAHAEVLGYLWFHDRDDVLALLRRMADDGRTR